MKLFDPYMRSEARSAGAGSRVRRIASTGTIYAIILAAAFFSSGTLAHADDVGGEPIVVPPKRSAPPQTARPASSTPPVTPRSYRTNDENDWKFLVDIYGWFPWMEGEIQFGPVSAPIDVSFDHLWKQLHMAYFMEFEVQKGDVGFYSDLAYTRLWQRQQPGRARVKTDMNMVIFDFGLYYEVLNQKLGSGPMPPRLRLQPLVGGRYLYMGIDARLDVQTGPPVSTNRSPVLNVAAPVLGLRGFVDFDEHWNLSFLGDGGGFGVDGMEKTWQAELLAGYRFRFQTWDLNLSVGYKALGIEISSSDQPIYGNLTFHGPITKLAFEF